MKKDIIDTDLTDWKITSDESVLTEDQILDLSIEEEIQYIFSDDPLFEIISKGRTTEEILPKNLFSELNRKNKYRISEAADLLNKKDYQIRNIILRNGLGDYVDYTQEGKLYRFDYKGLYRLYMIFFLIDKMESTPANIAAIVGVLPINVKLEEYSKSETKKSININTYEEDLDNKFNNIQEQMMSMFLYNELLRGKDSREKHLLEAEKAVLSWEKDMRQISNLIELHESLIKVMESTIDTNKEVLTLTKNTNKNLNNIKDYQNSLYNNVQNEKKGFFSKLFNKNKEVLNSNIDITNIESSLKIDENQKMTVLKKELEILIKEKESLEIEKEVVHEDKIRAQIAYEEFVKQLEIERIRLLELAEISNNTMMKIFLSQNNGSLIEESNKK